VADIFKGLKTFAIGQGWMRSDEQEKLDNMVNAYEKGGTLAHQHTTIMISHALSKSPDLKERTLEAIRDGYLQSYSDKAPKEAGASGSYTASDRSIQMPPLVGANETRLADRIFMMGHETEHARSLKGVDYTGSVLMPAIRGIASQDSVGPRDYTDIGIAYIERTRAEEGRAHIGGFNAMASYVSGQPGAKPQDFLRDMYEVRPERMSDFIEKNADQFPPSYTLKAGLTLSPDNKMPYSQGNIDAMKVYYADKAQLGAPYMNYPQECIRHLQEVVGFVEKETAIQTREDRSYIIDPHRLNARPELNLPDNGIVNVVGIEKIENPENVKAALTPKEGDHPLFAQAMAGVLELNREYKINDPEALRNLAASLALAAHQGGLQSIDNVSVSKDMRTTIATQGEGMLSQHATVGESAFTTPEAQSLSQLPKAIPLDLSQSPPHNEQVIGGPSNSSQKL